MINHLNTVVNQNIAFQNKTITIPSASYNWQRWNCFHLADYIRRQYGLEPLPDLNYYWQQKYLQEDLAPIDLVDSLVFKHCKRSLEPKDFGLLILRFNGSSNLGTLLGDKIVFMGKERATVQNLNRVAPYLESCWQYFLGL
jgi:hypothetical protein